MTDPGPDPMADPAQGSPVRGTEGEDTAYDDTAYTAAVTDLLGVFAHGALMASLRMAADAELAPTLRLKSALAGLAFGEYRQFDELTAHMRSRGIDPERAMQPFVVPFAAFHERTRPSDWLEGLVKAYVGEGIAKDFYRELAGVLDEDTLAVMTPVLDDRDEAAFIVPVVSGATAADPRLAGRLSLWGRRLMGEALSQGQVVAGEREALANLLVGAGADLTWVGEMFARLRERHQVRMTRLGLTP